MIVGIRLCSFGGKSKGESSEEAAAAAAKMMKKFFLLLKVDGCS